MVVYYMPNANELLNIRINQSIKRSNFWILPRDLCFKDEKQLFAKYSCNKKSIVEIGVFEGASALVFRKNISSNGTLHLIDPFISDSMNEYLKPRPLFAKLNVLRSLNGNVKWYRDFSYNVAKNWQERIDLLFIDGDHTRESCLRDWNDWNHFIIKDGIVIFHDARYGKSEGEYWDGWEGPTQVVDNLFRSGNKLPNWEIVEEAGTSVVVRKIIE
jgi:predicted O-methyltransferase YrrM